MVDAVFNDLFTSTQRAINPLPFVLRFRFRINQICFDLLLVLIAEDLYIYSRVVNYDHLLLFLSNLESHVLVSSFIYSFQMDSF